MEPGKAPETKPSFHLNRQWILPGKYHGMGPQSGASRWGKERAGKIRSLSLRKRPEIQTLLRFRLSIFCLASGFYVSLSRRNRCVQDDARRKILVWQKNEITASKKQRPVKVFPEGCLEDALLHGRDFWCNLLFLCLFYVGLQTQFWTCRRPDNWYFGGEWNFQ